MSDDNTARELVDYEYRFETTPRYKVMNELWELYDVKYMYLPNGAFNFIAVFRKQVTPKESIHE